MTAQGRPFYPTLLMGQASGIMNGRFARCRSPHDLVRREIMSDEPTGLVLADSTSDPPAIFHVKEDRAQGGKRAAANAIYLVGSFGLMQVLRLQRPTLPSHAPPPPRGVRYHGPRECANPGSAHAVRCGRVGLCRAEPARRRDQVSANGLDGSSCPWLLPLDSLLPHRVAANAGSTRNICSYI